jgi:hypothetical protein
MSLYRNTTGEIQIRTMKSKELLGKVNKKKIKKNPRNGSFRITEATPDIHRLRVYVDNIL